MNSARVFIFFLAFILCVITLSCTPRPRIRRVLSGTFTSYWGSTFWSYTFDSSMRYTYKTNGHFGNSTTQGNYLISSDTIYLTPFPKTQQTDSNFYFPGDTLIVHSDTCLLDIHLGYEHILMNPDQKIFHGSKKRDLSTIGRPIKKD
jgi:hypothetical protein